MQRNLAKVQRIIDRLLPAIGRDALAKVALGIDKAHADKGQAQVAGRLGVVSGEHPETAGVDLQALVPAEFGREVGDRTRGVSWVSLLEPGWILGSHVQVEPLDQLLTTEDLLLLALPRRPAEQRQVVAHRLRQVPGLPVGLQGGVAVALRQLAAIRAHQQRKMGIGRRRSSHSLGEQDVLRR